MIADIFTKALKQPEFEKFSCFMINRSARAVLTDGEGRRVTLGGRAAHLWNKLVSYA